MCELVDTYGEEVPSFTPQCFIGEGLLQVFEELLGLLGGRVLGLLCAHLEQRWLSTVLGNVAAFCSTKAP